MVLQKMCFCIQKTSVSKGLKGVMIFTLNVAAIFAFVESFY